MSKKLKLLRDIRVLCAVSTIAFTWLLASFGSPMAQIYEATVGAVTSHPSLQIEANISNAVAEDSPEAGVLFDRAAIESFYTARGNEPYWTTLTGPQGKAKEFIQTIENSWKHGLNPYTYHLEE